MGILGIASFSPLFPEGPPAARASSMESAIYLMTSRLTSLERRLIGKLGQQRTALAEGTHSLPWLRMTDIASLAVGTGGRDMEWREQNEGCD